MAEPDSSPHLAGRRIVIAVAALVLAFGLGSFIGARHAVQPVPDSDIATKTTHTLLEERRGLDAESQRLAAELELFEADNARLKAARVNGSQVRARRVFGQPLQRHEIQSAMLDNLRQLMAARDQYQVEHGRPPSTIHDLIGPDSYIKSLNIIDGESYATLPLGPESNFVVTSASGVTIGYQGGSVPLAEHLLNIDWPPELVHFRELKAKVTGAKEVAYEAYRTANQGKDPPTDRAVLSYFPTPELAADFVEFLDAHKAARLRNDIINFK